MRALVLTAPDPVRVRFAHHSTVSVVAEAAAMRPRNGELVELTTLIVLRELGRRAAYLAEINRLDDLLLPLITLRAPALLATPGVGPDSAAILLVAAGDNPERLRSEAAWAHLCGSAPIPASSGKVVLTRPAPAQPGRTARPTTPSGGSCSAA